MIDFAEDNLFVAMDTFEDVSAALGDDFDSDCFLDYSLGHPQLVLISLGFEVSDTNPIWPNLRIHSFLKQILTFSLVDGHL